MQTQEISIKLSDKLAKDAAGKNVMEKSTIEVTDKEGKKTSKEIETPKVEKEGRKFSVKVTAPEVSDFTAEQLAELIASRVENITRAACREADKDGSELSEILVSVQDVIGERVEIPDELVETVQNAFKAFLGKGGKSERAQKNNALVLTQSVTSIAKLAAEHVSAAVKNIEAFASSLDAKTLSEYMPLLERTQSRVSKAQESRSNLF